MSKLSGKTNAKKINTDERSSSRSTTSTLSTDVIEQIIIKLKNEKHRKSTQKGYYSIWKTFNQFYVRLDRKPASWEERLILFVGYLVKNNRKTATIRSYISAIKSVLRDDGVELNEDKYLLSCLTRACKYHSSGIRIRLPIQKRLVNLLLNATQNLFEANNQHYLGCLYRAIFASAYYGLLRVSEITSGSHPIRAVDVHIASNKHKILFVLRTSKTHWTDKKPQLVKISDYSNKLKHCDNNPFIIIKEYLNLRGPCSSNDEPLFIFGDKSAVKPIHMRNTLKKLLDIVGLNPANYSTHSFRIGQSLDHRKMNFSVDQIQILGCWTSAAVYTYLRQ